MEEDDKYNNIETHHKPMEGKAGPQSQLKDACIFRMKLAWHSPFC